MKMSGGKVGIVMVLLENKRKKKDLTLSFLSQRVSREVYLHKRSSTGMWMDGEGKVQTSKKTGVLSALGEDNLFISPKALLMGPKGR